MLSDSKDDLVQRALELLKKKPLPPDTGSTIRPGSFVTWRRGDGSIQTGFVDLLHTDDKAVRWAFVSLLDGTWAAVNVKYLTLVRP